MKRKLTFGVVGVMTALALTGCGKNASKYLLDEDYSQYVTVCEYKGVEAQKIQFDVSQEEIQGEIDQLLYEYVSYDEVSDRGIVLGDIVNLDYVATMDGEVSEEYSSYGFDDEDEDSGEEIVVGEGVIYPEVEDALIGMKTGESKTVEVTLTEEFAEDTDIGKKITVEATVNEISIEKLPEYTEEFVKENTDYDSLEAYEASVKEELMQSKEKEYKDVTAGQVLEYVIGHSEYSGYPDELYTQSEEEYDSTNAYYAAMLQMDLEDYEEFIGTTDEDRNREIMDIVNQELVVGAIAQKEGVDCTTKEIKQFAEDIYEEYGYESADEFLEDYSEQEIGSAILYDKVMDILYENASYVEISEEEYLAQAEEEYEFDDDEEDAEIEEDTEVKTEDDNSEDASSETKDEQSDSEETQPETKDEQASFEDTQSGTEDESSSSEAAQSEVKDE